MIAGIVKLTQCSSIPPIRLIIRQQRNFSRSSSFAARNRVYNSIRRPEDFHNLNLISASSRIPLITMWSTSWCNSCAIVRPILKELIEEKGIGEAEGGLSFAEVEMDSVEIGDLPVRFSINSMPTLLAFSRQEPQMETRLTLPEKMKDPKFIEEWLRREAKRGGEGGAGGSLFSGWFGTGSGN